MELESDGDTNCYWHARYSHQRISTVTEGLGNKRTSRDHRNYTIVEIGQDTEKRLGDLIRLAVTQTLVENHQLTLEGKTPERDLEIQTDSPIQARRPDLVLIKKKTEPVI